MTKINLFIKENLISGDFEVIETPLSIGEWIVDNYNGKAIPYSVFSGIPSLDTDITKDIDLLVNGFGEYTVLETPSATIGVAGWLAIISLVISVAAIALAPKSKIPGTISRNQESPNNALGSRSNQARPLQRVPDIKGTVKSIPDIIMPTYFKYQDLRTRVEHGYYCAGRKQLQIESIKDGDTPISLIDGASAQVYYPNNSPNSGSPDIQIGEFIDLPIYTPYRSNEVDGIALPAIDEVGATPIVNNTTTTPTPPGDIAFSMQILITGVELSMEYQGQTNWLSPDYYVGNSIILENFIVTVFPFGPSYDLDVSGTYEITEVNQITSDVYQIKFNGITPPGGAVVPQLGCSVRTVYSTPYNEWYYMTRAEVEHGFVNISAPNGIYRDTGATWPLTLTIEFDIDVEPVDIDGNASGSITTYSSQLSGNSSIKRGITVEFDLPYSTRYRCRVRRTTSRFALSGTIVDDLKWEDLYGLDDVDLADFGNVTTIQTKTIATPFATSVKDRQLNCIATEMLYEYTGSGVFAGTLSANSSAVQSYISDFIDPQLGNRPIAELDADGLLTLESDIVAYFGGTEYAEFSFTLDSTDITFQEYTQMLFNCIYSVAYRDGSIVKAHFERSNTTPSMLFTHRSKIPGSETYSRNFNFSQLDDGVEFKWTNPDTNTQEVIYLPADRSSVKPKKFESAGFRNYNQAYKRALREYNKILHEKVHIDFEATAEARYIKPGDVISVVKGTRTNTADGEVLAVSVDGYTLTLSQDVTFVPLDTHSIILKRNDGTTESIICTAGAASNQVILSTLPTETIRTGIDYQRRTEFSFGNDDRINAQLFIARTIDVSNQHTVQIKAVNYSSEYYADDGANLNAFSSGFSSGFS